MATTAWWVTARAGSMRRARETSRARSSAIATLAAGGRAEGAPAAGVGGWVEGAPPPGEVTPPAEGQKPADEKPH